MMFVLYVLGLTAYSFVSGRALRFPLLIFMLPVMVWNIHSIRLPESLVMPLWVSDSNAPKTYGSEHSASWHLE